MGPGEWPPRSGNQKTFRPGTKGRSFRGATHIRQCRSLADGSGSRVAAPVRFPAPAADATPADRCCPLSLALCAGAYWRALEARGLVRRLTGPFVLVAAPACTNRWFSTPAPGVTRPDHSPYWECGGSLWAATGRCQMGCRRVGRRRRDRRQVARGLAILPEVRHADARRAAHGSRRSWRLRSCQMFATRTRGELPAARGGRGACDPARCSLRRSRGQARGVSGSLSTPHGLAGGQAGVTRVRVMNVCPESKATCGRDRPSQERSQ